MPRSFPESLADVLSERKISAASAADTLKVGEKTVQRWLDGETKPSFVSIMTLCLDRDLDPWRVFGRERPTQTKPSVSFLEPVDAVNQRELPSGQSDLQEDDERLQRRIEQAVAPLLARIEAVTAQVKVLSRAVSITEQSRALKPSKEDRLA